jgi:maleate isomerase
MSAASPRPPPDGVFIACTELRSVGAIGALERDLGIPVASAVQASLWDALRLAGVAGGKPGFGRLFDL